MADEEEKVPSIARREQPSIETLGHCNILRRRRDHLGKELAGAEAIGEQRNSWKDSECRALTWALDQLEGELAEGKAMVAMEVLVRRARPLRELLSQVTEEERKYWLERLEYINEVVTGLIEHGHRARFEPTGNLCTCKVCRPKKAA